MCLAMIILHISLSHTVLKPYPERVISMYTFIDVNTGSRGPNPIFNLNPNPIPCGKKRQVYTDMYTYLADIHNVNNSFGYSALFMLDLI